MYVIEISNLRIYYLIQIKELRSSILDFQTHTKLSKIRLKLLVDLLVMRLLRWLQVKDTMVWALIFGVQGLYCMRWFVGTCRLKILLLLNFIRKSCELIMKFQSGYLERLLICLQGFWILILIKGILLIRLEHILGISKSKNVLMPKTNSMMENILTIKW